MLTGLTRRAFLLAGIATTAATACVKVPPRATPPPTPTATPDLDIWSIEAQAMLSDALQTLRTFDVYAAFRVSTDIGSGLRLPASLDWDPPTRAAWDQATHVTDGLRGRADQFFQAIIGAQIDPTLWREQRALADAAHGLQDLGDALRAYRGRIDALPPGDASGALRPLDTAWALWESTAAQFGLARGELISCSPPPTRP